MKKQHTTLTKEKWAEFPGYKQILMTGTEFERASNNLANKQYYYKSALSRAYELINLTAQVNCHNYNFNKELLRLRSLIAVEILDSTNETDMNQEKFLNYRKALYSLDSQALNLMYKTLYK